VLSASSSTFTLLLSILILKEPFGWLKLAGVVLCWVGNAFTVISVGYRGGDGSGAGGGAAAGVRSLATADGPHQTTGGVLLCSASAFLYAVYTVAIRRLSPADVTLFFGLLGAFNGLLFAPVVGWLHYTGRENLSPLAGEAGRHIIGLLLLKVCRRAGFRLVARSHGWAEPQAERLQFWKAAPWGQCRPSPRTPPCRPQETRSSPFDCRAWQTTCCPIRCGLRPSCSPHLPPQR
jgi:hypothetical protein